MEWSVVGFGRYKGKTLPQIVFTNPDWFFWAVAEGAFKGPLAVQAERAATRARRIRIPQPAGGERHVVEYAINRRGKFAGFEAVPESREPHPGSTATVRRDWIDLAFPRSRCRYDKAGGRLMARQAKFVLFGSESVPMTRARAGAFFEDDGNFDLS